MGTITMFFSWPDAYQGWFGGGQVWVISFVVPKGTIGVLETKIREIQGDLYLTRKNWRIVFGFGCPSLVPFKNRMA